jgi:hypothetical protein
MAVRLNESALRFFLEEERGPIGRDLRRRAENVTTLAEVNASGPVINIQSGDLHSGIRFQIERDREGLFATVGTDARHRGFSYPAFHDRHGRPWLTEALRAGFDI